MSQAQTAAKMRLIAEGQWRKRYSNSRSLREGKGYGEPLQASIAVSGLNLVSGSTFRAAVSEWQERDRWFESGSLQRRVRFISEPLPPTSGASTACCGRARRCRPNPSRRPKDLPAPQGDATIRLRRRDWQGRPVDLTLAMFRGLARVQAKPGLDPNGHSQGLGFMQNAV